MVQVKLLKSTVGHERFSPKKRVFSYDVFYLVCPVVDEAFASPGLLSFNRFNMFGLYTKDHGAHEASVSWRTWITRECESHGVVLADDDKVELICHPRMLGYAFNPISYWLVYEKDTFVKAVICEVRNTFGGSHNYFLAHGDGRAIVPTDVWHADKVLYVSPFNTVKDGRYQFTFDVTDTTFKSVIDFYQNDELVLNTYMGGTMTPLSNRGILHAFMWYPLMTFLIVGRIHYQAVRLWLQGVPHTLGTRPPETHGKTSAGRDHK